MIDLYIITNKSNFFKFLKITNFTLSRPSLKVFKKIIKAPA